MDLTEPWFLSVGSSLSVLHLFAVPLCSSQSAELTPPLLLHPHAAVCYSGTCRALLNGRGRCLKAALRFSDVIMFIFFALQ